MAMTRRPSTSPRRCPTPGRWSTWIICTSPRCSVRARHRVHSHRRSGNTRDHWPVPGQQKSRATEIFGRGRSAFCGVGGWHSDDPRADETHGRRRYFLRVVLMRSEPPDPADECQECLEDSAVLRSGSLSAGRGDLCGVERCGVDCRSTVQAHAFEFADHGHVVPCLFHGGVPRREAPLHEATAPHGAQEKKGNGPPFRTRKVKPDRPAKPRQHVLHLHEEWTPARGLRQGVPVHQVVKRRWQLRLCPSAL